MPKVKLRSLMAPTKAAPAGATRPTATPPAASTASPYVAPPSKAAFTSDNSAAVLAAVQ